MERQGQEMLVLVESAHRPLSAALKEPRDLVAAALLLFLARRDMDKPLTQQDYQRALLALRRTPDLKLVQMGGAKYPQTPAWVKPLRERMTEALKRKAKEAGEMAARHAAEQAQAFRMATAAPVSEDVQRLGSVRLSRRLVSISNDQAEQPYRDIKRRLALGVALGLTLADLVRSLMRVGGRRGKLPDVHDANAVAEAIADSIFGVASRRARMVAVTEIANAYNVQMLIALDQLDTVPLKRWDARHDKRTCVECYAMDGRVAELHRNFPNGSMGPPLHPHCRCYLTIWPSRRSQGDE